MNNLKKLQLTVLINYTAVGVILGFVQGGIAPILRQQGTPLTSMVWVFALYLPFGLAFLWAPLLERFKANYSYRQQIFIGQILACLLLLVMAVVSGYSASLSFLWGLALLLNVLIASLDLALDGLSSLSCSKASRPSVASAKVAGISLGALVGGGVLVARFSQLHWSGVFISVVIIFLIAMPFVHLLQEPEQKNHQHCGWGVSVCWRDSEFRTKLWRIALLSCCLMALFNLNRLLLVEMGVPLKTIGMYLGTLTPLGSLLLALLLPLVLQCFSYRVVFLFVSVVLLISVGMLIVFIIRQNLVAALVLSITIGCLCSGILVIIGSTILDWAKSGQSATDYALLYGLGRLCATLLLIGLPILITIIGWPLYYTLMSGLFMLAMYVCLQKM